MDTLLVYYIVSTAFQFDIMNYDVHELSRDQLLNSPKKELKAHPFGFLLEENKATPARRLHLMLSGIPTYLDSPSIKVAILLVILLCDMLPHVLNDLWLVLTFFHFDAHAATCTRREV